MDQGPDFLEKPINVLGLMSGTSLDGVDAAIITTNGNDIKEFGPSYCFNYTDHDRKILRDAIDEALGLPIGALTREHFAEAGEVILRTHLQAIDSLRSQSRAPIDLIGFHGQTVLHRPQQRLTVQIGDAALLAQRTGLPVVADLRLRDMKEGGQGAPLVPIYHARMAACFDLPKPLCFLNLGGVANLTWIGDGDTLIAFDVGPGNGLIDQWVGAHGLGAFDAGGRLALSGQVDEARLDQLMANPYFALPGPKSLDRYDFDYRPVMSLSAADGAATLAAFTAEAVARAKSLLPGEPALWVLCGGGRHNQAIVEQLRKRVGHCLAADEIGLRGDMIEAEAIAFLAVRSLRGLPITFPGTTGIVKPASGGMLYPPPRPLRAFFDGAARNLPH